MTSTPLIFKDFFCKIFCDSFVGYMSMQWILPWTVVGVRINQLFFKNKENSSLCSAGHWRSEYKAYNRHLIIWSLKIEDCTHLVGPKIFVCSYLEGRQLILTYQGAKSPTKNLPGGLDAGTWLGGLLFLVKFNGACLRQPIARTVTKNYGMQVKFVDDLILHQ